MKSLILFLFFVNVSVLGMSQTVIKMKSDGGVSIIPCKVNGLNLNFIFDTGASDVSISVTEASFMLKNGYLDASDIIGTTNYLDANGNISEGVVINLKQIEIAGLKLHNVRATIIKNIKAPLLLGQSAISKLGKIQIDLSSNTLTILKGNDTFDYSTNSKGNIGGIDTSAEIIQEPKSDSEYFERGRSKVMNDNYEGSIEDFTKAIEINPNNEKAYFNRGLSKGILRDYSGAIKDYDKVIEMNPRHFGAYCFRGVDKANNKDYRGGLLDIDKSIAINPKYAIAYSCRGEVKDRIKDYRGAIIDYTKAIQLDPENTDYYQARADVKKELKDYVGALSDYNKAIELDTEDYMAYHNRGNTKVELKNYLGAILDYNKAIELNPQSANSFYARAIAKEKIEDFEGALDDYNKTLAIDSTFYMASIRATFVKQDIKNNEWTVVLKQDGQTWYVKSDYVSKEGSIIKIWVKEEIKTKSFTKNGKTANYNNVKMLMLVGFSCQSKMSKLYSVIYYDSKGNTIERSNDETLWEDITPETILEEVFTKTCERFN